jgi:Nuclear pore localisation protein NPL4
MSRLRVRCVTGGLTHKIELGQESNLGELRQRTAELFGLEPEAVQLSLNKHVSGIIEGKDGDTVLSTGVRWGDLVWVLKSGLPSGSQHEPSMEGAKEEDPLVTDVDMGVIENGGEQTGTEQEVCVTLKTVPAWFVSSLKSWLLCGYVRCPAGGSRGRRTGVECQDSEGLSAALRAA